MCNACLLLNAADPTRTVTIRKKFVEDYRRRFKRLIKDIRETVKTNNALALQAAAPGQFDFPRSADKIPAFMDWLQEQTAVHIYGVSSRDRIGESIEAAWQNVYLDSAYKQGIRRARAELKGIVEQVLPSFIDPIQVAFNSPVHADRVGAIYTRAYSELKGITDAMDQQISRVLADGLLQGYGPEKMAKAIVDRVESIGIHRATLLARTETIRAHHLATIQEYRNAGVTGVKVLAEFTTAGDGRVCPICAALNHKIYTLDEAETIIPVHPQCRCVALPYVEGEEEAPPPPGYAVYDDVVLDTPAKIREALLKIDGSWIKTEEAKNFYRAIDELDTQEVKKLAEFEASRYSMDVLDEVNEIRKKSEKVKQDLYFSKIEAYSKVLSSPEFTPIPIVLRKVVNTALITKEIDIIQRLIKRQDFPKDTVCDIIESEDVSRAYYGRNTCSLSDNYMFGVMAHEIGHHIERYFPGALESAVRLLLDRTAGKHYYELLPKEWVWDAGFVEPYAAKDYSSTPGIAEGVKNPPATELISVGIQHLLTNPVEFARHDPEHFDFIIKILKGMK